MSKMIASKTGSESQILAVGSYRPKRLVPNSEIVDRIESSDEWIQQRTGIESRRFADETETVLDMATWAAEDALKKAKLSITDIDTIIVATITFPFQAPSAATAILQRLGHPKAAAFDINAACAGFSYGVAMAHDFIKSGTSKTVLVIGAEKISDFTDPDDRATAFIFADGAGAVVIGASQDAGIGPVEWGSDADNRDAIQMNPSWMEVRDTETQLTKAGSKWPNISQEGQKVFRWAVFSMSKAALKALESAGLTVNDIDAFIPHQANVRIIETMAKEMDMPDSVIIADDIRKNGNTSAASIPLAMDALLQKHPELHGKLALLIGYGAGLVYAGQVVKLPPKP
ncbi:FabH 3-oxoacyl-[acyl-carrier-protein] [Candidatus Nanopelagicaceae bacterium]|jgi:3-oxoacyl-[acyl-carrier-protein] synthase-3